MEKKISLVRKAARGIASKRRQNLLPFFLVTPAVVALFLITIYPMVSAFWMSFQDLDLLRINQAKWIGFDNYIRMWRDPTFLASILRTARWTFFVVLIQMLLAIPIAIFLNLQFRGRGLLRSIVFLPYVMPIAATSVIWVYMLDANFGSVNELLYQLGLIEQPIIWLSDPFRSFGALISAMIWYGTPLMVVMLLAALSTISLDLYDAARVDGAGFWQQFYHITLPHLMPTILVMLLLRTMWMSHHVELIYLMTYGGPGVHNMTLAVYSFMLTTVEFKAGYASAMAIMLGLSLLGLALIYMRQIEKRREWL